MISSALKAKLQTLPLEPGCYLMKDKNDTIIYVGKAKKLKNRVNQYFVGAHNYKTTKLVSNIVDFDYIVTSSEKEALVLEINLIKKYRPRSLSDAAGCARRQERPQGEILRSVPGRFGGTSDDEAAQPALSAAQVR